MKRSLAIASLISALLILYALPNISSAVSVSWDRPAAGRINPLSVLDTVYGNIFHATSTTQASTFPYASSTAISATTVCLTADTCRTTWPTGGSSSLATTSPWVAGNIVLVSDSSTLTSTSSPLSILAGGTATSTQVTNGLNYFDGTKITSGTGLTYDGTNLAVQTNVSSNGSVKISPASGGYIFAINGPNLTNNISQIQFSSSALRTFQISNPGSGGLITVFGNTARTNTGTGTNFVGINATSTPWGLLSIAGSAGGTTPLFVISSSTSAFATTTVFEIDQNGSASIGSNSLQIAEQTPDGTAMIWNSNQGTGIRIQSASIEFSSNGSDVLVVGTNAISTRANNSIQPLSADTGTIGTSNFPYAGFFFGNFGYVGTSTTNNCNNTILCLTATSTSNLTGNILQIDQPSTGTSIFSVNGNGTTTLGMFGTCNGSNALQTSSGVITCGTPTGATDHLLYTLGNFVSTTKSSTSTDLADYTIPANTLTTTNAIRIYMAYHSQGNGQCIAMVNFGQNGAATTTIGYDPYLPVAYNNGQINATIMSTSTTAEISTSLGTQNAVTSLSGTFPITVNTNSSVANTISFASGSGMQSYNTTNPMAIGFNTFSNSASGSCVIDQAYVDLL